jgi:O-antigen ligase
VITRRQRTCIVAGAVAAIVVTSLASDGAYFSQSWGWVALAFLVPSTVLLILDRITAPGRMRIAFASLMGALGVWITLSTIWSISPSGSAREAERMLVYVSVALAVALVLRRGDGPAVAGGTFVGVCAITTFALATRLFPDRFDTAEDATNAYRLAEPLGYWNAFGLVAAIAVLFAIGAVAHGRRTTTAVVAGAVVPVLVMALYFAFSRGSWLALFFGFAATIVLDPRRVTILWTLLVVAAPSAAGVAIASRQDALTGGNATAAAVMTEGHRLAWLLVVLVPCSAVLAWIAHRVARRVSVGPRVQRGVAAVLATVVLGGAAVAVLVAGGPTSALNGFRDRYEAPAQSGSNLNDRLFQFSGTGRGEMITVAWDFGASHPVAGTGAGTFEILWYEHRPSTEVVRDAHFLYIETFNELGLVGLALLCAALVVPLVAGVRARRSRFVAPACGAYLAWVSSSALDWHWEMVALTTTALLAASVGLLASERRSRGALLTGTRLAMVGITGTLSVFAVWSLVGNQALFAGRDAIQRKDWSEARADARRAKALLFWSHEPDFVRGDAAAGLGDREGALRAYRDAVETDPRNWVAWLRVAQVARGAERAAAYDRVRELNPRVEGLPGE